jgi:hypothetical protein
MAVLAGRVAADSNSLPARITLGIPAHYVIGDYKSIEYSVLITNTSKERIWFRGQSRQSPFYRLLIRPTDSAEWADQPIFQCGLGAEFHEIAPGASSSFVVLVGGGDVGNQLRVEVDIYESPNKKTKPLQVASNAITIN